MEKNVVDSEVQGLSEEQIFDLETIVEIIDYLSKEFDVLFNDWVEDHINKFVCIESNIEFEDYYKFNVYDCLHSVETKLKGR